MNIIKEMSSTMTTAQMLNRLRKTHSDADILLIANECGRGTYEAVSAILNCEVVSSRYSSEERQILEDNNEHD